MRKIRLIIAALFIISPLAANAIPIEVTGAGENDGSWEITLVEGSFNSLESLLMTQVWWGDTLLDWDLAVIFADALGEVPGIDNDGWGLGPFFAYFGQDHLFFFAAWSDGSIWDSGAAAYNYNDRTGNYVYATATTRMTTIIMTVGRT